MINVVSKYKHKEMLSDVYIGRGSVLGNPYTSIKGKKTLAEFNVETREDSILEFEKYLHREIEKGNREICNELNAIWKKAKKGDVNLICYCKPKSCHGDIIKSIIESKL